MMENHDLLNNDLQVSPSIQNYLSETAKWGKFLAILGFISAGILFLVGLLAPLQMQYSNISEDAIPAVKIITRLIICGGGILLFFPSMYLNKFSLKMKTAFRVIDQDSFDDSFSNLKSMFKFYAILYIIVLSFYALIIIFAVIAAAVKQ